MKNALGVSLGICALVWTYIAVFILGDYVQVWAGFIAWGAYFTVGKDALVKTISATIFGAVLAGIAVLIHTYVGMLGDFAWPVAVGITVWGLTAVPKFSDVPANVFGYAAAFGLMLLTNSADMYSVTSVAVSNPVITASISFILGSLAGMVSEKVAGMLG
tara:strand:+ start:316 stop:795 length:480 start_codon:yes stop_codon:yes gene_type:complete